LLDLLGLQVQGNDTIVVRMARIGLIAGVIAAAGLTSFIGRLLPGPLQRAVPAPLLGLILISGVLLTPILYPFIARLVAGLLKPLWGIEGRLAVQQLSRNSLRSGLTSAVLCVALVISIAMGQSIRNNIKDVEQWSQRTFKADYLLRSTLPELSYAVAAQLPEELREELRRLPDVETVHALNLVQAKVGGEAIVVVARSFDAEATESLDIAEGTQAEVTRGLLAGEAVIGTALARRLNLGVGDELAIHTRQGDRKVRIAATVTEYIAGGMAAYIERTAAQDLFRFDGADVYMVTALPGGVDALGKTMESFCEQRGYMLQSNAEFRARIHHMMGGVIGFLWLLLALVFVVASLGIVNTLTMNVMEQTREIAVLRSVALQRRQVRAMILLQALALGLCSLVPGVGIGLILAFLMNLSTHILLGQPVEFQAEIWFVLACCAACLAIAMGAAWVPARRASRLEIVRALQYE
jgi:putative ABC transport system permease protein